MAYASWSVVFGEQPSAAKWNILGTNDAAFNSGNGVLSSGLGLSSSFTSGLSTQANAGTAGGTIYYINLGGIRMAWGTTGSLATSGAAPQSTAYTITLPTSFFTTVQLAEVNASGAGTATNTQYVYAAPNAAVSTTTVSFYLAEHSGSNGTVSKASFLVIGT